MSDLERIRELALKESVRLANEQKKGEDQLENEAHRLAKEHLPLWIRSIESAIHEGKGVSKSFCYTPFGGWPSYSHYRWRSDSKGPPIDLDELFKLPVDTYTTELTVLLGEPFCVWHLKYQRPTRETDAEGCAFDSTEFVSEFCVRWK